MDIKPFQKNGYILMLALDHRGSFKEMAKENTDLIDIKYEIIQSVFEDMTGTLVDPLYGLPAYYKFENPKPFLLPLEQSGYVGDPENQINTIQYKASELKEMGATGVKLLIYYKRGNDASKIQIETSKKAIIDAHSQNMPIFLEIVTYGDTTVTEAVSDFINENIKPDVYKIAYPGNKEECEKVTKLVKDIPWIMLTRGQKFEEFYNSLKTAKENGCSGFLAGRAIWQDGVAITDKNKRQEFFNTVTKQRFKDIKSIFIN